MKINIFLLLFTLLVSCSGDIENETSNDPTLRLGSALSENTDKILSAVEHSYLNKICDSFEIKTGLVPGLLDSKQWIYRTRQKRCSDGFINCGGVNYTHGFIDFSDPANSTKVDECNSSEIILDISGSGSSISFNSSSPSDDRYYFTDYQSHEQGLLKDLCAKRSEIEVKKVQNPSSGLRVQYFFYSGNGACSSDPNILCVDIDHGVKNQANQYIIEYIHSMKINTNIANPQNQRGLVTERSLYEACSGSYSTKSSTFVRHQ